MGDSVADPVNTVTLETVIEQQRLHDVLVRGWCIGVDTLNWKLYRSVLAGEVEMDFPDASTAGASTPKKWQTDAWIKLARQVEGFDATQHCVTNFIYDINGDSAVVRSYIIADHHLGGEFFTLGGQSIHTFERTAQGWRIVKVGLHPWWMKGNPALMGKAAERYLAKQAPRSAKAIG